MSLVIGNVLSSLRVLVRVDHACLHQMLRELAAESFGFGFAGEIRPLVEVDPVVVEFLAAVAVANVAMALRLDREAVF